MSLGHTHIGTKGFNNQQGIGLVEVLVALLLLAVAALGYSALQARSLQSTDESLTRTNAINLIRNAAEKIRTNGVDAVYLARQNNPNNKTQNIDTVQILKLYATHLNATSAPADVTCNQGCTSEQQVIKDVRELWKTAGGTFGGTDDRDIKLGMETCPYKSASNKSNNYCIFAAWKDTNPRLGTDDNSCMNYSGIYLFNANCVMMEAY